MLTKVICHKRMVFVNQPQQTVLYTSTKMCQTLSTQLKDLGTSPTQNSSQMKLVTCGRHMKQECHHRATREGVSNRNLKVLDLHSWTIKATKQSPSGKQRCFPQSYPYSRVPVWDEIYIHR